MEEQTKNRLSIEQVQEIYSWMRVQEFSITQTINTMALMEAGDSFVQALKQINDKNRKEKYEEDHSAWHSPLTP